MPELEPHIEIMQGEYKKRSEAIKLLAYLASRNWNEPEWSFEDSYTCQFILNELYSYWHTPRN